MRKQLMTMMAAAAITILAAGTAFAGEWKTGATRTDTWWYDNGDGTYAKDGWHWIDGNGDGMAECYYFDGEGWMLAGTTTPDGYQVDGNGAWVQNGAVQTKQMNVQAGPNTGPGAGNSATESNSAQSGARFSRGTYGYDETTRTSIGCKWMKEDGTYAQNEWVDVGNMQLWFWDDQYARPTEGSMRNSDGSWDFAKTNTNTSTSNSSKVSSTSSDEAEEWTREAEEVDIDAYEERLIELANKERRKKGLDEVEPDSVLMEAAKIRAEEIVEKYGHRRPDGGWADDLAVDLGYETTARGIVMGGVGEVCMRDVNTPEAAVKAWMNSSGHKAIMLDERSKHYAVGAGVYQDGNRLYYVMLFGQ